MLPDFGWIQVFWEASDTEKDQQVEALLERCSSELRYSVELSLTLQGLPFFTLYFNFMLSTLLAHICRGKVAVKCS